jgi:hypothetical protein
MTDKTERSKMAAILGKRGGQARAKRMPPEERKAGARRAAQARWAAKKGDK